jgi:hypothetical protein
VSSEETNLVVPPKGHIVSCFTSYIMRRRRGRIDIKKKGRCSRKA